MIDKTPAPKTARGPLPPFLPVPRQRDRHDGWTPERQQGFIEALADTGSVKAAAHAVNMAPEGAYQLRRHPEGASFRKAWEHALQLGVQRLEDIAMDRALNGVEVPVYSYGKLVGTRTVYNDRLLMFILRHRAARRFQADGRVNVGAVPRAGAGKREDERWMKVPDRDEMRASILRKIEAIRKHQEAGQSPRTLRLKQAYERSAELDEERQKEQSEVVCYRGEAEPGDTE